MTTFFSVAFAGKPCPLTASFGRLRVNGALVVCRATTGGSRGRQQLAREVARGAIADRVGEVDVPLEARAASRTPVSDHECRAGGVYAAKYFPVFAGRRTNGAGQKAHLTWHADSFGRGQVSVWSPF